MTCYVFCFRKCVGSRTIRDFMVLYLLTFVVILPLCCHQLRHTPYERFFSKNETQEKSRLIRENEERYNQSLNILRQFDTLHSSESAPHLLNIRKALSLDGTTLSQNREDIENTHGNGIAISIITTVRNKHMQENYKPYYVIQTVAYFLRSINETGAKIPVHFSVCNVDAHPSSHMELQLLPQWIPIFQRFVSDLNTYFSYDEMLNKEKEDYIFCLEKAMEQNLSYSLVVEDDALPHNDLFSVLLNKIYLVRSKESEYTYLDSILFVKLYHPERLLGYISLEWERIPELLSLAAMLTLAFTYLYVRWRKNDKTSTKISFIILFIYSILILLLIGRQNLLPLRRMSKFLYQMTPAPSCCTPAMLYPRTGGRVVLDYLRSVQCKRGFAKDIALDKLVRDRGLSTRFIQPNLFQHIGHFSAIRTGFINPFLVQ